MPDWKVRPESSSPEDESKLADDLADHLKAKYKLTDDTLAQNMAHGLLQSDQRWQYVGGVNPDDMTNAEKEKAAGIPPATPPIPPHIQAYMNAFAANKNPKLTPAEESGIQIDQPVDYSNATQVTPYVQTDAVTGAAPNSSQQMMPDVKQRWLAMKAREGADVSAEESQANYERARLTVASERLRKLYNQPAGPPQISPMHPNAVAAQVLMAPAAVHALMTSNPVAAPRHLHEHLKDMAARYQATMMANPEGKEE